jgi:hypothetical protein
VLKEEVELQESVKVALLRGLKQTFGDVNKLRKKQMMDELN